jgi:type II secretory pathway pseudopilin PulG
MFLIWISATDLATQRGRHGAADERGFTLIDIMIATSVMMIGVLSLMLAMTTAVVSATNGQQQAQAKQYAQSAMESIFSARDINNLNITSFSQIANTNNGGVFLNGFQNIYNSTGCDGIIGTLDDGYGPTCVAGASTALTPIAGFERQIVITVLSVNNQGVPTLLQIAVTVQYQANNGALTQSLTSYMGNYNTSQIAGAVPSPTP